MIKLYHDPLWTGHRGVILYTRVEWFHWFGTFLRFSKSNKFLPIRCIFRSSIPENQIIKIGLARRKVFNKKKIPGTLKINIFFKLLKPSWYIKEQSPRRKLKITNVKYFFLYFPKMGNAVFNINNSKTIFWYFFILSFKKNLRIHSHLLQASKRFEICFFFWMIFG